MEKRERFDIMVKNTTSQDQISSYLVKATLSLRDRENISESVRLFGSGSAIPIVILMNEILRTRFTNLSSIITLENMKKNIQENGQNQSIDIPAIRIKLTLKPTEEDKSSSGYQGPSNIAVENHIELFDYVMVYAKNLYFWSTKNRRPNQNNKQSQPQYQQQNIQHDQNNQETTRPADNLRTRNQAPPQERKQPQDYRRQPQQDNQQDQRPQQNRDYQKRGRPRQDRQRRQEEQPIQTETIKRGDVRTRAGIRK